MKGTSAFVASVITAFLSAGSWAAPNTTEQDLFNHVSATKVKGQNLKPLKLAIPSYPASMMESRREGEVDVSFLITHRGDVIQVKVIRATNDDFAGAAQSAISQWRFEPIVVDGNTREQRIRLKLTSRPQDK